MHLLSLLLACQGKGPDDTGDTGDTVDTGCMTSDCSGDSADSSDSGDPADSGDSGVDTAASYYGTIPADSFPAPTFTVLNQDGETRTRDDLAGHPTVMWFYPAAGTSG